MKDNQKALETLLLLTEGLAFRFILGSGVRFPKEFDVFNILKRHPNNKSEVEVVREKSSLANYGNIREGDTNKIIHNVGESIGKKNIYFHDNIYDMRVTSFEKILDAMLREPLFTFASYNIKDLKVGYKEDGGLYEIDLILGKGNTLKLFDFRKEEEYKKRTKGIAE